MVPRIPLFALAPIISLAWITTLASSPRPNILWITCEDMSPTLGCYGDKFADTPNLDKFASQSIRYTHAFATNPVCSPSRSCLITGVYANTLGTQHLRADFPIPRYIKGWPSLLRDVGYYTTNNVKTDYNTGSESRLIQESWDESSPKAHWRNRKGKDKDKPFFCIFNDMTTHQSRSMVWPYGEFREKVQSRLGECEIHDPAKVPVPPYYPDTHVVRKTLARFYDCVSVMDKNTGKLLEDLEKDGLAEDTIVFFYSDHGSGLPRHKRLTLDSGLHIPLLVRFPQKFRNFAPANPGESTDRLVSFIDFPPTVLDLLGLEIPGYMQGTPFLGAKPPEGKTYVFGARDRVDEAYDLTRSVRDKQFLYVRNYWPHISANQPSYYSNMGEIRGEITRLAKEENLDATQLSYAGPTRPREALFDTLADPLNLENLAGKPEYSQTKARLSKALAAHLVETRDLGFYPEEWIWENVRAKGTNPYEFAKTLPQAPSPDLLKILDSELTMDEKLGLLGNDDPVLQYWGLKLLGGSDLCESCFDDLRYTMDQRHPTYVRTEAAAILARHGQKDGLDLLVQTLGGTDPDIVLRAARALELLGETARPAIPAMHKAHTRWKSPGNKGSIPLFIWFSMEAALVNLGESVPNPGL
jgi:N-sulfoglucosamine sulfohydrolase